MYWAHQTNSIHPGHVGGRPGKSRNDAFVTLTSCINHKWREGKVVMGTFLDVKLAYPSVHRKRLIHDLERTACPPYLCYIINSVLSDRTTSLKIDDHGSQTFSVPNGLPQGSPLSVTLYLLYNSNLLLPSPPLLNSNNISIAYIDNITHLLATDNVQQGIAKAEEVMARSNNWGKRYGAIFDNKKTNFMIFTRKQQLLHKIEIACSTYTPQKEVKWLGVTLTPTLSPGPHLRTIKTKASNTIKQLSQIIRPTYGLCQREAKVLIATVMTTSTGMMKQTPSLFLKLYGGIKDFTNQHIKLTHNYLHSKLAAPIDDAHRTLILRDLTNAQQKHSSPLNNLLEKDNFLQQHITRTETLSPFPIPPWSLQVTDIINLQLTKEQAKKEIIKQIKSELTTNTLVFFTDGSLFPGKGGGAAAILMNTQTKKSAYVGKDSIITNFETELIAIFLCQELLTDYIRTFGPPSCCNLLQQPSSPQGNHLAKKECPRTILNNKNIQQLPNQTLLVPGSHGHPTKQRSR
ncbi:hypothetical protein O181_008861 [Austropuccinia psidii MF-1]|uniref:Reverse transcriptase domain-containing protein n=1 Tax=Austropuccinia psidii MF-1 TaxID=1389203 RepID=A0A9Q3BQN0_9BASI|nr:hypothetical protein [Austropuccinia psidii MF-1]